MRLVYYCLYLYLILKPYYVFSSGNMQPADFFIPIGFIILICIKNNKLDIGIVIKNNFKFLLFLLLACSINGLYAMFYYDFEFIKSSLYLIFNFLAIILFTYGFSDKTVTLNMQKIIKLNIVIQLLAYVVGLGSWYDSSRYMGTFNDPNQFGYFILMSYMLLYLICIKYKNNKDNLLFLFISVFLIFESASAGMFLGIVVFLILQFMDIVKSIHSMMVKNKNKIILGTIFMIPVISLFIVVNSEYHVVNISDTSMMDRVVEKFDKAEKDNGASLLEERGYDRFLYYPRYILYGFGDGYYGRLHKDYHQGELHATFPGILFCYGIIPTLLLLSWIYDKIKNANLKILVPLLAVFTESFTLLNQRQVFFWILILFISFIDIKNREMER